MGQGQSRGLSIQIAIGRTDVTEVGLRVAAPIAAVENLFQALCLARPVRCHSPTPSLRAVPLPVAGTLGLPQSFQEPLELRVLKGLPILRDEKRAPRRRARDKRLCSVVRTKQILRGQAKNV